MKSVLISACIGLLSILSVLFKSKLNFSLTMTRAAPLKVTLAGKGQIYRIPEQGLLSLTVDAKGKDPEEAMHNAQQVASSIQETIQILAKRGPDGRPTNETAVLHWSSDGMAMQSWSKGLQGKLLNESFTHSIFIKVCFRDLEQVGSFAQDVASKEKVKNSAVKWVLTDETRAEMQKEAIIMAYNSVYAQARAYADAVGLKVVRPVEISEADQQHEQYELARRMTQTDNHGGALPYMPTEIPVEARCKAVFELE